MVNLDKSSIFFVRHCPELVKKEVMNKLDVYNEALHESYLGMPTDVRHSPPRTFRFLHDRVWQLAYEWCLGQTLVSSREGNLS